MAHTNIHDSLHVQLQYPRTSTNTTSGRQYYRYITMGVVDQVERVFQKTTYLAKIFFALHKRGWGKWRNEFTYWVNKIVFES